MNLYSVIISDLHSFRLPTHAHLAHLLLQAKDLIMILLDICDHATSNFTVS